MNLVFPDLFFSRSVFCTIAPNFIKPILKSYVTLNYITIEYGKMQTCLGPEKLICHETKFALTDSFQKVNGLLAFSGPEKFNNSFHFKILSIVKYSFNLIKGFRYLQFQRDTLHHFVSHP